MQARQAGMTGNRLQSITLPPTPAPTLPTAPEQKGGTPNFQPALTLALVQRTCDTMARVSATAPDPSVPGFPVIFTLLEDGANTTPNHGSRG